MSWNVRYGQGSSTEASASRASTLHHPTRQNIYDKWLVVRFTIAFIALGCVPALLRNTGDVDSG